MEAEVKAALDFREHMLLDELQPRRFSCWNTRNAFSACMIQETMAVGGIDQLLVQEPLAAQARKGKVRRRRHYETRDMQAADYKLTLDKFGAMATDQQRLHYATEDARTECVLGGQVIKTINTMTDGVTMAVIGVYQTVHTSGKHKKTRQKVNDCVKKLVRQVEQDYEDPIIAVMGDFNDAMDRDKYLCRKRISRESIQRGKPPDEVVDWLLGQEFESPHMEDSSRTHQYTRRPTGGAVGARSMIDYIFLNPAGLRRVVKCGIDRTVCRRVCSSDHDLLYVDLLLKAPQGKRMQQTRGAVMYNMLTEIPMKRKKTKKTQEDDDMDGEEDDGRMFEIDDGDLTKKELEEYTKRLEEMAKTEKGDDIVRSRRTILNEAKELLQTFAHRVTREGGNDWDYDKGELPKRNAKECEDLDKLMERFTKLIEKVMKKQMWVSKENPRAKADQQREMSKAGDLAARRIIGKKSTMKLLIAALESTLR